MVWMKQSFMTVFQNTKKNCYSPSSTDFKNYGAKGIKIADDWIKNPLLFEQWALTNGYSENLVLSRKDKTKDFSPENCIWISKKENVLNSSRTNIIDVDGEIHSGKEWAKILGLGINSTACEEMMHKVSHSLENKNSLYSSPN